jgi:hypothetical protein
MLPSMMEAPMARLIGPPRVFAILAAVAVPALGSAQPSITATSINGACAGTGAYCGNWWSTIPGAHGNWQMFLSTNGFASFQANPLAGIPLALGVNTINFAASVAGANPMALNIFLDGATANPSISGYAGQGLVGSLASNAGQSTYNPYAASHPGGTAAPLSYSAGGFTVTLTRFEYNTGPDRVGTGAAVPDGGADWNGVFDLTVTGPSSAVPEPATVALLAGGLLGFGVLARSRRRG